MLNIGRLNRRITFLKRSDAKDALGQDTAKKFEDYKTVWATVAPLRGSEYWEARKVRSDEVFKITVRYKTWVTEDMRIRLQDGKVMDITSITDPGTNHEMLEIMATEHVYGKRR